MDKNQYEVQEQIDKLCRDFLDEFQHLLSKMPKLHARHTCLALQDILSDILRDYDENYD